MDINTISITGNLTTEPERIGRKGEDGHITKPLGVKLRVANNYRTKRGDDWVDATNYINVVVWGKLGDLVNEYTRTGSKVAITGELRWREWHTSDEQRRESLEVHADDVVFLSPKPTD